MKRLCYPRDSLFGPKDSEHLIKCDYQISSSPKRKLLTENVKEEELDYILNNKLSIAYTLKAIIELVVGRGRANIIRRTDSSS